MSPLSTNLKHLLSFFNLSENELAKRSGVRQQVINRILNGANNNPQLETLSLLAKYFSITISQLIGEDDLPNEPRIAKTPSAHSASVPLLEWGQIKNLNIYLSKKSSTSVATDANITNHTFALINNNNSMEPKFPENSILIFDSSIPPKHGDYVLLESEGSTAGFRQLLIKNESIYTRCLNLNHDCYTAKKETKSAKIIATLIQAKIDFF